MNTKKFKKRQTKVLKGFGFFCCLFLITSVTGCSFSGEKKEEQNAQKIAAEDLAQTTIPVEGMTCNACVASVKKKLNSLVGVEKVKVSLQERNATVFYEEGTATPEEIAKAIDELGYKAGKPVTVNRKE